MKRENILISEDYTTKKVAATKFTTGDVPVFDCSIHFGEEGNDVTMQNCNIKDNAIVKCSPDDTYDFETGALIALMKMCGREKVLKAVEELYSLKEPRGVDLDGDVLESKIEYMDKEIKRLNNVSEGFYKFNCRLIDEIDQKNREIISLKEDSDKVIDELIEENEKLKLDCEKLQHGYIGFYKLPTKREEMWENILGASKCPPVEVKVAKQDVTSFLRELQDKIPEVRWNGSDCPPLEYTNPYWFKHDYIYFALFRNDDKGSLRMCYDDKPHSWISKPVIEYIAPMRWDLFKKGRIAVKVNHHNYEDFYNKCEEKIGRKPRDVYKGTFTVYYKYEKELEKYIFHTRPYIDTIPFAKKIVNWEDVR